MGFLIRRTEGILFMTKRPLIDRIDKTSLWLGKKTEWILEYSQMHQQLYNI